MINVYPRNHYFITPISALYYNSRTYVSLLYSIPWPVQLVSRYSENHHYPNDDAAERSFVFVACCNGFLFTRH